MAHRVSAVSPEPFRLALKLPQDVIRLSVGEPDFDTPDFVRQAAKEAIDRGATHYSPAAGFDHLRVAVANKLRRDNKINCDPETEVLITPGSSSGIFLTLLALVDPGEEVIVPDPAWFHYTTLIELCGAKPVRVPVTLGDNPSLDALEVKKRVNKRTRVMILNSPSNPTGMILSKENLKALGEIAEKHNLTVISDEVYEKIIYPGHTHVSPASMAAFKGRTITSNGFSKAYAMTGWRVGYLAGPPEIVEKIVALNGYILVCPSSVSQEAAYAALRDQRMEGAIKKMVDRFSGRRKVVLDMLAMAQGIKAFPPQGAFYTWVDISAKKMSSVDFTRQLLECERVGVLPGTLFGEAGESFIRISFAVNENDLKIALERIRKFATNT
jgi:aspartate/methionine/tyrosine aminotransferase